MKFKKLFLVYGLMIYLEIIYHAFVFKSFNFKNTIYILLFSIVTSLFLDLITNLFRKKINKWLFIGISIFLIILFLAQFINYRFYGNVISIYSVFNGGQIFGFFGAILSVIKHNIIPCLLFVLPIPLLIIFNKRISCEEYSYKEIGYNIALFLIIFVISVVSLFFDNDDIYSAKKLYWNKHVPNSMAQTFGIMTTMRLDLERTISGFEEESEIVVTKKKEIKKEVKYNITDIDFNKEKDNHSKDEIKNIDAYMANQTPSEQNIYTGKFKGKNLIVFVAEAFSPLAVDKDVTPTLYKLVNDGFNFTNFYSPIYYVSTSDGEYVSLTSLLPKESVWSFSKSSNNYLPYTYGNIFKDLGYTTYAFHDGTYKYYHRDTSHPNMGYTYMACGNGLEKKMNCKKWPQSDIEMINATYDMYAHEDHFMTYYMTISGHLEYNFSGNNMSYKNKSLVDNLPYGDSVKAYKAAQIELDRALEDLINKLSTDGKLDNTVIVLSADHYPYGLTTVEINEVNKLDNEKFDIHKNNLIIWNSEMKEPVEVDKIAESLDIVPTVLNLFGVNYDSRLLMGTDILSNSDGLVIFNDRSWRTEYGTYDASSKHFTPVPGASYPDGYVDEINNIVYNKYTISKSILENDYYRELFNKEN